MPLSVLGPALLVAITSSQRTRASILGVIFATLQTGPVKQLRRSVLKLLYDQELLIQTVGPEDKAVHAV